MNIHKHLIEQVVITGAMADIHKAHEYCNRHGYNQTQSEPKRISMSRVDTTRFKIVAERVQEKSPENA